MYEVLHIFNVWFRERTGELKVLELVPFARGSLCEISDLGKCLTWSSSLLCFSEALYPERCSTWAPGPCLDGGEWSPSPDGPEPWLLPPTSPGREEWQPRGGHQDRWRAVSVSWVDGSPGRRRRRRRSGHYPPSCVCTQSLMKKWTLLKMHQFIPVWSYIFLKRKWKCKHS